MNTATTRSTEGGDRSALEWERYADGEAVMVDSERWYVGPSLPRATNGAAMFDRWKPIRLTVGFDLEMLKNRSIATLCEFHDDVASAKVSAERRWTRNRMQASQVSVLGRRVLANADLLSVDGHDISEIAEDYQEVTRYAAGIYRFSGERHGGFLVDEPVLSRLPEPCHKEPVDGLAWYEEDAEWAMLALGCPSCFTTLELDDAKASAERSYPELYAILNGRAADAKELDFARRGFSREKAEWSVTWVGTPQADGMTPVTARMSSYWGIIEDVEPDFEAERPFLVPTALVQESADELLGFELDLSRFDPTDGPLLMARPGMSM